MTGCWRWGAGWALMWAAMAGCGGGGAGQCRTSAECPAGQQCIDGRCRAESDITDAGEDDGPETGDAEDGGEVADAPRSVHPGFVISGGGIRGTAGPWRYQFSLGAPQPMGVGQADGYRYRFGPAAVHAP